MQTTAIPVSYFGRDHWSTFAYLAYCCVHRDGIPQREKMRVDPSRHLVLAHEGTMLFPGKRYPTILHGGVQVDDHDDYDCADDIEEAGLLVHVGTGVNPCWRLTERGWRVWEEVQRAEASRLRWSQFRPSAAALATPPAEEASDG